MNLPSKWHDEINVLVAAVEKHAEFERLVGICKTQLAEMEHRAREGGVSARRKVATAEKKLKEAKIDENAAFIELDAIRSKTLSFMLTDDLKLGVAS